MAYKSIYILNKLEWLSFLSDNHSERTWYIVVYDKQNKYCNSNNCVMRAHFYGYLLLRISMKDPCHKHIKHQTCLLKVNILCSMSWHKSAMENVISHFYVNQFVILLYYVTIFENAKYFTLYFLLQDNIEISCF